MTRCIDRESDDSFYFNSRARIIYITKESQMSILPPAGNVL